MGDKELWENQVSFGADYRSGNTKKSLYTFDFKRDKYSESSDWINRFYSEFGQTEGLQTEGLVRASSEYRSRFDSSNYFTSVLIQAVHDSIREVRIRGNLGPNVGIYLIDESDHKLDVSVGINSTYDRGVKREETYAGYRFLMNLKWKLNDFALTYTNLEFSGNIDDPLIDYYSWLVIGIKSSLSDALSLFAEVRSDYDNLPSLKTAKKNDTLMNIGLNYDF